jgi:hypothetical protein
METARDVTAVAAKFYNKMKEDNHSRYRSWEYCYYSFYKARTARPVDEEYLDYLSLQLAFYLASWGMYRGSAFLLQKDYKIHVPVIKEVLQPKYDILFGLECSKLMSDDNVQKLLSDLIKILSGYYGKVRGKEVKSSVSDTLLSKVLMGTLGCVPAYDSYFKAGISIKNKKVAPRKFNMDSLIKLAQFYQQNYDVLEEARSKLPLKDIYYPQMKLLDMGFWQIGADLDEK